jgi:hypothetical protein
MNHHHHPAKKISPLTRNHYQQNQEHPDKQNTPIMLQHSISKQTTVINQPQMHNVTNQKSA